MKKKRMVRWPIKSTKSKGNKKERALRRGEQTLLQLLRDSNDSAIKTDQVWVCCSCGFEHRHTYEVWANTDKGYWFLGIRSYANESTRPKKKKSKNE